MRSNKGITLTSLIIYIIVFSIVIGTMATFTNYFNKNLDETTIAASTSEQYTRLVTYITNDINSINLKRVTVVKDVQDYIDVMFLDNSHHIYLYDNEKIYYIEANSQEVKKKITLCNKVTDHEFSYEESEEKDSLKISISIDGITYNNNYSI